MLNTLIVMPFKVSDQKLFKKNTKMWEQFSNLMNIEFDSEPVYGNNDKYIKTKIKSYGNKANRNFQSNKIPEENTSYKCLSLIMIGSVRQMIILKHSWKSLNIKK